MCPGLGIVMLKRNADQRLTCCNNLIDLANGFVQSCFCDSLFRVTEKRGQGTVQTAVVKL
jgi:hypothetical protein